MTQEPTPSPRAAPRPSEPSEPAHRQPPLATIGVIMISVLVVPTILFYAVAPEEPLQEGVSVFSDGRQRVYLADPERYRRAGYSLYCVLESHAPLTVIQAAADRPDGSILAQAQSQGHAQAPFCPSQAEVTLRPHQVRQKESLWRQIKENLARLIRA
jgi:hypothetical protein